INFTIKHCISEKKYQKPKEEERRLTDNVRRVNYLEYKENELYIVDKRKQQVQSDILDKRPRLQPELKWDAYQGNLEYNSLINEKLSTESTFKGIDLEYMEPLNVSANEVERAANKK
ncbi:2041_t:CDS:2, partial [Dentiscutata heterogama]